MGDTPIAVAVHDRWDVELPYKRIANVKVAEFDGGMRMVRLIIREGKRITQVDLDADTAQRLAQALDTTAKDI